MILNCGNQQLRILFFFPYPIYMCSNLALVVLNMEHLVPTWISFVYGKIWKAVQSLIYTILKSLNRLTENRTCVSV